MTTTPPIFAGLASFGMSGYVFHAPLLAAHPHFQLRTVLERSTEKSRGRYPDVTIVRQFEDLLRDDALEMIVVNTPDYLHYDMARQALEAGKHVVVEKPFTLHAAEADELIRLARARGKVLSVFHNRRWDSDFLTVQQVVQQGWLGQLVEYEAHYDRFRNYIVENTWKEGTQANAPATGILYNLGSHLIDQALALFGPPRRVTADIRTQRPGGRVPDACALTLEYSGLQVTLKSSYLVREPGPRYTLHGTEGSFVKYGIDPQEEALKAGGIPGSAGWGQEPVSDWGLLNTTINGLHFRGHIETLPGNYLAYYDNVYRAIRLGEPPAVPGEAGADVIRIIEAAVLSDREKRAVAIS